MYVETSNNYHGLNVYCSFERTDIIQISNISFYYNRFSGDENNKAMGRFRIQLLKENNFWLTRYTIPKNDNYTTQSEWKLLSLDFTEENYGKKLVYDQIDSANCNMCFSNISITHFIFKMNYEKYFKDLFESIPDYKKIVLLIFLIQKDKKFLKEIGFSKNDIIQLNLEFKKILINEFEDYLDYIKDQEESVPEKFNFE